MSQLLRAIEARQAVWKEHQQPIKSQEMLGMFLVLETVSVTAWKVGPLPSEGPTRYEERSWFLL